MKIRIIENPELADDDVIVECHALTSEIQSWIQKFHTEAIVVSRDDRDVSLNTDDVLFFETEAESVFAHTSKDSYRTRYRLYELEDKLPNSFVRISKSAIVNINHVAAIERNITSARSIQFFDSHKVVYVSRMYFPNVKKHLDERSL